MRNILMEGNLKINKDDPFHVSANMEYTFRWIEEDEIEENLIGPYNTIYDGELVKKPFLENNRIEDYSDDKLLLWFRDKLKIEMEKTIRKNMENF